ALEDTAAVRTRIELAGRARIDGQGEDRELAQPGVRCRPGRARIRALEDAAYGARVEPAGRAGIDGQGKDVPARRPVACPDVDAGLRGVRAGHKQHSAQKCPTDAASFARPVTGAWLSVFRRTNQCDLLRGV